MTPTALTERSDTSRGVVSQILSEGNVSPAGQSAKALVGILAAAPEPLHREELARFSHASGDSGLDLAADIASLVGTEAIESVGQYVQLMWPLRSRLANSRNQEDVTILQAGARALANATASHDPSQTPIAWSYAPQFFATAKMFSELREFLARADNFEKMLAAAPVAVAIPAWGGGVRELITHQPEVAKQRLLLLEPLVPRVIGLLESQYAPLGHIKPILEDVAELMAEERDDALLRMFSEAVAKGEDLTARQFSERAGIALVQFFGEAGHLERAVNVGRKVLEKTGAFDSAHFLAIQLYVRGHQGSLDTREGQLREALDIEQSHAAMETAAHTASYPLRHTVLANIHQELARVAAERGDMDKAKALREQARMHIEARWAVKKSTQIAGYRADILHELGETDDAWRTAASALDKSICSVQCGRVMLLASSLSPLEHRFVSYCKQQAACWAMANAPYLSSTTRARYVDDAVMPWLVGEGLWPMAVAVDADRAEALQPGIVEACEEASRGVARVRVRSNEGLHAFRVRTWEFEHGDGAGTVVVGLEEFGIFARGRDETAALQNLEHVLELIADPKRQDTWHAWPVIQRLRRWLTRHVTGESVSACNSSDVYALYRRGHHTEAFALAEPISENRLELTPAQRREVQRHWSWLLAETGETRALDAALELFDDATPIWPAYTDLQKVGSALGLIPREIVRTAHERFEALGLARRDVGFAALERFYWGLYLLGREQNSQAEEALAEALDLELHGRAEDHVIARIGDALAEVLRRRGEVSRAVDILNENIAVRRQAQTWTALSRLQLAKCRTSEEEAVFDLETAREEFAVHNPKEMIRCLLVEARVSSDETIHNDFYQAILRRAHRIPCLREDAKLQDILQRWDEWRRVSFSPELTYWGL